ncbi:MAG: flagellar hook assembly protein FlgD [Myxococcales bacterium]|nr:flagellar hook assembly protein FlgD [Myxococcales bacterium]
MNVNEVSGLAGGASATQGPNRSSLGQDQFMKLLLTQMQNQSPLDPMDSNQFLGQLAQFTTIEQLAAMRGGIDNMALGQAGIVAGQTVTMIGKDVTYEGNQVQLVDGTGKLLFDLAGASSNVKITIEDAQGRTIRTLELGSHASGKHDIAWDGLDAGGSAVPPRDLSFPRRSLRSLRRARLRDDLQHGSRERRDLCKRRPRASHR